MDSGAKQDIEKSGIYEQAGRLSEENTEESLEKAMLLYRSIRGWQDADAQYIACRTRLGRMRWLVESAVLKEEEKRFEAKMARRRKIGLAVLTVVLLCLAVTISVTAIRLSRYISQPGSSNGPLRHFRKWEILRIPEEGCICRRLSYTRPGDMRKRCPTLSGLMEIMTTATICGNAGNALQTRMSAYRRRRTGNDKDEYSSITVKGFSMTSVRDSFFISNKMSSVLEEMIARIDTLEEFEQKFSDEFLDNDDPRT